MGRYGIGFNFKGGFTTFPGTFTSINADNLDARPVSPIGIVAILAEGGGFFPPGVATSVPISVGSPRRFLSESTLLTCAELAVKPFAQIDRGAGQVIVVPVNQCTVATKTLNSSAPALLATLSSKGWGTRFNAITVKAEAGKVTITLPTESGSIVESFSYTTVAGLVTALNERSALVSAVFALEGTPVTFDTTAMAGGTEPAATTDDWAAALHALDGVRITAVHVASYNPAVWALLADYAIQKRLHWDGFTMVVLPARVE